MWQMSIHWTPVTRFPRAVLTLETIPNKIFLQEISTRKMFLTCDVPALDFLRHGRSGKQKESASPNWVEGGRPSSGHGGQIKSQSLEDTQVEYISQKYISDKYTFSSI